MRKFICLAVALFLMVGNAYALSGDTHAAKVYSISIKNTTGIAKTTVIPTTSIVPLYHKIIGFDVMPYSNKTAEVFAALYDDTTTALTGEVIGESEAPSTTSAGKLYNPPVQVQSGVVVQQGSYTDLTIYFIKS